MTYFLINKLHWSCNNQMLLVLVYSHSIHKTMPRSDRRMS